MLLARFDTESVLEVRFEGWYCFGTGLLLGAIIGAASWLAIRTGGWLVTKSRRVTATSCGG
jgi:hypothetical protein